MIKIINTFIGMENIFLMFSSFYWYFLFKG